jgi:hypothetical protein
MTQARDTLTDSNRSESRSEMATLGFLWCFAATLMTTLHRATELGLAILSSRSVELGLIGSIGATTLLTHPTLAAATTTIVVAKLVAERAMRWPFTPAALALAVGRLPMAWPLALLLLVLACVLVCVFIQPKGPPDFTGRYAVGYADAHLLVDGTPVLVRALFPIEHSARRRAPYYAVRGKRFCSAMMGMGSPPPLNRPMFAFLMQHLCLLRTNLISVNYHADREPHGEHEGSEEREGSEKGTKVKSSGSSSSSSSVGSAMRMAVPHAPAIVFSHGLSSSREQYVGLLGEWASRGMVVFCVEHTDGSAVLARFPDGTDLPFSFQERELSRASEQQHVDARRRQLERRSVEVVAALHAARALFYRHIFWFQSTRSASIRIMWNRIEVQLRRLGFRLRRELDLGLGFEVKIRVTVDF